MPRGAFRGRAFPQITACGLCPPSVSKVSFQDEKHEWMLRRSLRFCGEDLFFFLFFTPEFVGKNRNTHHKIPPGYERAHPSENCASKGGKRLWPPKITFLNGLTEDAIFFCISRYLTENYFDIVWEYHASGPLQIDPPKIKFLTV